MVVKKKSLWLASMVPAAAAALQLIAILSRN
jgi:hypothetical protein